jgi:hypothetical protein|tara:strand:- start:404 stop:799 length:396 start_codon:yes stop_codon:yes gene_type:complete
MKVIDKNAHISKPYKMKCLIQNLEFEDELHSQNIEDNLPTIDLVDTINVHAVTSFYYTINGLKVEGDLQFYNYRDNEWSWVDAQFLTIGSYLFTDHDKLEKITQVDNTNEVLEGCMLAVDTNFFAKGYLVR